MSKGGSAKVGYKYHLGLHYALGYGPWDKLTRITFDDRVAWEGENTGEDIVIDAPDLFGGTQREGGVGGTINIMMGGASQGRNAYLQSILGEAIPAFRGVLSLVFNNFYIGNNPYLKKISVTGTRTDLQTDGTEQWYLAKANINDNMNPAHIVRETHVSKWGMGYNEATLDLPSLQAVADTLYDEGLGLSLAWREGVEIRDFQQTIMDHIHGVLRQHPTTGLISVKLLRADYVIEDLPVFDQSNIITMDHFQRRGWGETVNEVVVVYRDRDKNSDIPITVQDLANIEVQGGRVISTTRNYPGIPDADLAGRVALRDLNLLSAPLSTRKFTVNRTAFNLLKGDVFALTWPRDGMTLVPYRVTDVNYGTLEDGRIQVECIEDYFALPDVAYTVPETTAWTSPMVAPVAATYQRAQEASFWDVHNRISASDIATLDADFGYLATQLVRPAGMYSYNLWTRVGSADYVQHGSGEFSPTCTFAAGINQENSSTLTYSNDVAMSSVVVDGYGYIDDELVKIAAINTTTKSISFDRGVLDTVPVAHSAGARFWYAGDYQGFESVERVAGLTVDVKALPYSGLGQLALADATAMTVTFDNRYQKPYAPGNFKINSSYYPTTASGHLIFTWAHRARDLQTADIISQTDGAIGPELETSYTIRLIDADTDTLKHTESGLDSMTWTYPQADRIADFGGAGPHNVRVEIESERDGLPSWQYHAVELAVSDSGSPGTAALDLFAGAFAVNQQYTPNMTVRVRYGTVINGISTIPIADQSTGTITAPVGNPRIDRVVISETDATVSVITGTPAGSPVAPAIPSGYFADAQILLTPGVTAITTSMITDERAGFTVSVAAGADGLSAYDIAVANGFVGSESAWLASLVGATGAAGATGATGAAGSVWRDGAGAPSGGLGVDGDYYLNDSNGDVYFKAAGAYSIVANIKGATGATGADGVDGATGATGAAGAAGATIANTQQTGTVPLQVGSLKLAAGTYQPWAMIGCGDPAYAATLLFKSGSTTLATVGGSAGGMLWRQAGASFTIGVETEIDIYLYANSTAATAFLRGIKL